MLFDTVKLLAPAATNPLKALSCIEYAPGGGPDARCYRIDCGKINRLVPGFQPRWNIASGAQQLYEAYVRAGLTTSDVTGPRFYRLGRLRELLSAGELDSGLRWRSAPVEKLAPLARPQSRQEVST